MDKDKTFFFLENCTLLWSEIFSDNYLFKRPENLKFKNYKNLTTNFSEKKDIDFCCIQIFGDMITPLLSKCY